MNQAYDLYPPFAVGFVETTIENIKQLHSKINMEALQLGKTAAKKKEDALVPDLIITLDVLRNLLFMNEDAKVMFIVAKITIIRYFV